LQLFPKTKQIYVIDDYLKTGRNWTIDIKKQLKNISISVEYNQNLPIEKLQQKLASFSSDTIVLLGVYFKDSKGTYFTYEKIGKLLANSAKNSPVFCLLRFNISGDIIGGCVIDGYAQGKMMAKLAKEILNGRDIHTISVVKKGVTATILNVHGLKKFHIDKSKIPSHVKIINTQKTILLTQDEKKYLKTKKVIKMCIDPNWMPYESFDKAGHYIGISADIFKLLSQQLNIQFQPIKTSSWEQSVASAKERKCDIFSMAMATPERKKYMNFTTPYLNIPLVITTRKNISYINKLKNLRGKKIGITKGYAFAEILRKKYPYLDIVDVKNIDIGLKKVQKKELFGFIDTLVTTAYKLQKEYQGILKISGKFDEKWRLAIGTRNDEPILQKILQKAIDNVDSEQKQAILNRWMGIKFEEKIDYTPLKYFIFFSLLVALIILYFLQKINVQKNKFEAIYNGSKDAIAILDLNSKFLDVNPAYGEMTGFSKKELLKKSCYELTVEEDKESSKLAMQEIQKVGYIKNFEKKCLIKHNKIIYTNMSMALLQDQKSILISIRDVTEIKNKEKALELAKAKAEEATKLKSQFLANMSHEIRTPMNGILGMAQLALEKTQNKKEQHYLEQINFSANSLLNIINDILDFSKIEAGKMIIEKIDFNMNELFARVRSIVELKAVQKGLLLTIHYVNFDNNMDKIFYGDSQRLVQILINLIGNAIKFTEAGTVDVQINLLENTLVRFSVIDSGIGMSKEQQEKLFQSFSQADGTTTRKYGGTGLGLAISKQLVELMDGKIWVESEVNVGSRFIFEIPLPKGSPISTIEKVDFRVSKKEVTSLKGSKVLLVEDNKINQEIVFGFLDGTGIHIDIANNGQEAVNNFNTNPSKYELILMDLQMPIMGGIEATELIREKDKNIPIIALTANAMKEDIEKTQQAGMNEHLNKPIEVEKLYATLLKYISKKTDSLEVTIDKEEIVLPEFINIDTDRGLKYLSNNKKLYLKILHDFYMNYKELKLEELNNDEFKRTTHTIKGLSVNIGAKALNSMSKELDETQDKNLLPVFYKELYAVIEELKEKLQNTKEQNSSKPKLDAKTKEYAKKRRSKLCNDTLNKIQEYKLSDKDKEIFEKLEALIHARKYKEIMEIL